MPQPRHNDASNYQQPSGAAVGISEWLDRLEVVVADLADPMEWNWTRQGLSERDAADGVLVLMVRAGLIEHRRHPSGGNIWKVNGKLYGRLDDITLEKFDALAV